MYLAAGITPGIKKMPTSVLWGYFAYLAIASLPGSEFWERFLLLFVEPARRSPKYPPLPPFQSPWASMLLNVVLGVYAKAVDTEKVEIGSGRFDGREKLASRRLATAQVQTLQCEEGTGMAADECAVASLCCSMDFALTWR